MYSPTVNEMRKRGKDFIVARRYGADRLDQVAEHQSVSGRHKHSLLNNVYTIICREWISVSSYTGRAGKNLTIGEEVRIFRGGYRAHRKPTSSRRLIGTVPRRRVARARRGKSTHDPPRSERVSPFRNQSAVHSHTFPAISSAPYGEAPAGKDPTGAVSLYPSYLS